MVALSIEYLPMNISILGPRRERRPFANFAVKRRLNCWWPGLSGRWRGGVFATGKCSNVALSMSRPNLAGGADARNGREFGKREIREKGVPVMKLAIIGSTGLVGSQLAALATSRGHAVNGVSKDSGVDVTTGTGLDAALDGVDVVVDVIQSPNLEEEDATRFFTTVAANLGRAATAAGARSVVLSIIGVDRVAASDRDAGTGYDGYYKAKFAQETATREHAPGARVVRSAQFHDISRQAIGWGRDGDRTTVPDLLIQPLAVASMVEVALDVATGDRDGDVVEVAGPRAEHLGAMSAAFAHHAGDDVRVVTGAVGEPVRDGILLPGPDGILVGPTFDEWLSAQPGA
jgi:dTDP-4-dehydrorhamnose reductase